MLIKILLIVAIVIQTIATLFAIRLIRTTKYNSIWILFTIGFTLLSVERVVQFLRANGQTLPYEVFVWLGLVISISMSIGVMYAHKLFKYIARLNRQRQLLNKRILTAVLRTEEKSRSRFAKDLHDGLGPLLSSARMSLSALQRESLPADQQEIIGNTTYVIDEAIRSLREISNNLSPHVLNDFGLARGIQNFVGKSSAMHDVKIRFTTNLRSERYDTDVEVILYRVVCELVNNSLKHSGCTEINLSLSKSGDTLALDYTDNGRGFNPAAVTDCGMGLSNIVSRINSLNGRFDITSAKGVGMQAKIRVSTQAESAENCNDGTLQNYIGGRSLAVPQRDAGTARPVRRNSGRGRGFDRRGISGDAARDGGRRGLHGLRHARYERGGNDGESVGSGARTQGHYPFDVRG